MKSRLFSKFMIAVAALAMTAAAFAGSNTHKASFQIAAPAQVNGTALPAGDYVAKWEGTGPDVQVSIVRDGKTVATVPAKVVESGEKASTDMAEFENANGTGTRELSAVRFGGKKFSLEFSGPATQARKGN